MKIIMLLFIIPFCIFKTSAQDKRKYKAYKVESAYMDTKTKKWITLFKRENTDLDITMFNRDIYIYADNIMHLKLLGNPTNISDENTKGSAWTSTEINTGYGCIVTVGLDKRSNELSLIVMFDNYQGTKKQVFIGYTLNSND